MPESYSSGSFTMCFTLYRIIQFPKCPQTFYLLQLKILFDTMPLGQSKSAQLCIGLDNLYTKVVASCAVNITYNLSNW